MLEKFTKDSAVVKVWVSLVLTGVYKFEDVPEIKNLREVVAEVINEMTGGIAVVEPKAKEEPVAEKPVVDQAVEESVAEQPAESQPQDDQPVNESTVDPLSEESQPSEVAEAIPTEMA